MTISFDAQSSTETNYDFVQFFSDAGKTQRYGEEKYHGGRGGSSKNFPGCEVCPLSFLLAA
jgi:hypothetical protein